MFIYARYCNFFFLKKKRLKEQKKPIVKVDNLKTISIIFLCPLLDYLCIKK